VDSVSPHPQITKKTKIAGTDEYNGKTKLDNFVHFHLFSVGFILLKSIAAIIRAQALCVVSYVLKTNDE
jgi:hypothetical protein